MLANKTKNFFSKLQSYTCCLCAWWYYNIALMFPFSEPYILMYSLLKFMQHITSICFFPASVAMFIEICTHWRTDDWHGMNVSVYPTRRPSRRCGEKVREQQPRGVAVHRGWARATESAATVLWIYKLAAHSVQPSYFISDPLIEYNWQQTLLADIYLLFFTLIQSEFSFYCEQSFFM